MGATTAPPGPRQKLPGLNLIAFRRDPLAFLTRVAAQYGDLAHYRMGGRHVFLLNHPDLIKDVLVTHDRNFIKGKVLEKAKRVLGEGLLTSEGDFHLRQRRLAQPAFHRQRIAAYSRVMSEYAARHAARWLDGQTVDLHQEMMRLTLAIVGKTLFDADIEGDAREIGQALAVFMELFGMVFLPFSDLLEKLPLPATRRLQRAKQRLDAVVYRLIAARRASGGDRGDLLSMLLAAQDTEGDGGGMTDQQLRDECVTLILAGHETTANALTWTFYLLSQNPEVETRLQAEADQALGDRLPTADDLPRLPYTEMVLAESMRLYPPAWSIARRAREPYSVRDYVLPQGAVVLMSQYVTHRDARWFPDPGRFDPERWRPEARAARPRFSYFPFGGGPRNCIGEPFAWMEGILLLALLARRWRMRLAPGQRVATLPVLTLRPRYGMRMTLERRAQG